MAFTLPELPFAKDALEPFLSSRTFDFHHGKHHNAYVTNLNKLIAGTPLEKQKLEDIILHSAGKAEAVGIFNNSAQTWNHSFYWHCLTPNGGGKPPEELLQLIERSFGGVDKFVDQFKNAAGTQFGSGWAWLVMEGDALKVVKTPNADTPLVHGQKAILTIDVWEHAYYLDYQNRRPDYISTFVEKLINWNFAIQNLKG